MARKIITNNDTAWELTGVAKRLSFAVANMNLPIAELSVDTPGGGNVTVFKHGDMEIWNLRSGIIAGEEFYVVEVRNLSGSVKKYWRIGRDGINTEITEDASWKYRLFSGQDNPVTFAAAVVVADRIPSKTMEWIAGESAILGLPVTPKYQASSVSSTDEEVSNNYTDPVYTGIGHTTAIDNAITGPPTQSIGSNTNGVTNALTPWLTYKVDGATIIDPPFLTKDQTESSNCVWNMAGGPASYSGVKETTNTQTSYEEYTDHRAIGDKKVFGSTSTVNLTTREKITVAQSGPHASYSKQIEWESSSTIAFSPLMYGSHVISPAVTETQTEVMNADVSIAPVPTVDVIAPASGSYNITESGSLHDPDFILGSGDDEFVCGYHITTITRSDTLACTQAQFTHWDGDVNVPQYSKHGNYGSPLWSAGSFTQSTENKLAFRVKGAITQIVLSISPNEGTGTYIRSYCDGRESDTHFVVLHSKETRPGGVWFYEYELIVINKVTGGYERIPIGDETTWGQNIKIAFKGQGPDVYTPPDV
jgi:hypothetical protein